MSFKNVLNRLKDATRGQRGDTRVTVQVGDLKELLLDYERIDEALRVPDECCATGQSCDYEVCTINGEQQCKYCGKEHPDMQSPRITEQDSREIKPDAYVPVHTRTGEYLWANTVTSLDQDHPSSYKMAPVYLQQSTVVAVPDNFNGDDRKLIECATALLELDTKGVLVPHGLGGHARTIIESFVSRASNQSPRITEQDLEKICLAFMNRKVFTNYANEWVAFKEWVKHEEGIALLNKLNDKPESVGG